MFNREIYKIWAPTNKRWVDWARPVAFIGIDLLKDIHDFIDYEILRTLYYDTKYTILISFDTKVQKILKGVSSCDKFQNSIEVLKSLKK